MKGFTPLILLTLLFVTSVTSQSSTNVSSTLASSTSHPPDTTGVTTNTTAGPTTGVTTNATADPTTGVTTNATADPTTGVTTNATADPTTCVTTNATADPTTGVTTNATADPTTGVTTNATADPTTVSVTTTPINNSSSVEDTTESTTSANTLMTVTTVTTPAVSSSSVDSVTTVPSLTMQTNDGSSPTTVTGGGVSSGTVSSVTFSRVTSSENITPKPSTTGPSGPCQGDPCSGGSSCVSLNSHYFCLCSEGYYYNSSMCNKGKVFPGTVTVRVSGTSDLESQQSEAYQDLYNKITTFFADAFSSSDYGQTVILKVSTSPSARSEMRAGEQDINVSVVNIFVQTTKENETSVSDTIQKAITDASGDIRTYARQERCDYYGCQKTDAQDDCSSGVLCTCKEGLTRPNLQVPFCLASGAQCPDTCNAEHKRQCFVKSDGSTGCDCLPGYKQDGQGTCQECAFGFSGVNCEDNFKLILTIVGVIAGILILSMAITLIISARSRNKQKNIEEQNLIDNEFQNLRLQQTTGFSNPGADRSLFPKVRTNISRDDQLQNPYANQRGSHNPYTNRREW
ncbi:mucin-13 [Equus asinus]|uniref:mucin-13 n=1 Tax=Equus asinus TaxID=9793 RepID=UPI0038F6677C